MGKEGPLVWGGGGLCSAGLNWALINAPPPTIIPSWGWVGGQWHRAAMRGGLWWFGEGVFGGVQTPPSSREGS